jgi:glycosyltransferase involved in cell wall biosynthesis
MNQAQRIFVDGPDLVEALCQSGIRSELPEIQYLGIDAETYPLHPTEFQFFPKNTNAVRICWHGKHSEYNGPLRFIELVHALPNCIPRMCGDGPQREQVLERLNALGHPEWYLGPLSPEQVRQFLCEAEIGVYPLKNMAGMPRVLLEAMAAGCVTLSTPVGACQELLRNGENGFICQDDEEMHGLLKHLIDQPDTRRQISSAGRKTIHEFWSEQATLCAFAEKLERLGKQRV